MTDEDVVTTLTALANVHRLKVFRLLVADGGEGLLAGDIAAHCDMPPSNLSFHLTHLVHAGLIASKREGRNIRYRLNVDATRDTLDFLIGDCCGGRPELCTPISKDNALAPVHRMERG